MKTAIAITLMASLATPALAAGEKPEANAGKGMHCRKLAIEKYKVQDGRALNKAIGPAIQRCKQYGPSAL
ncbi:MAG TPA: hypothetical protein VGQ63_15685 [Pseudolabrys sp.]|jgi:hypothetical protein|nr:hypothetical protein [Pseudolabrys sp.]